MNNPYSPPKKTVNRIYKTPIIAPLSVVMAILIYIGYTLYYIQNNNTDASMFLWNISFELYLLSEIGMFFIIIYNGTQLKSFLKKHPVIFNQHSLQELKPILRTNMYSALIMFFF